MNPWNQIVPSAPVKPATIRPTPSVPGQNLGPLAGGSGVPRLAGGPPPGGDTLAPPPTVGAPAAATVPTPNLRPSTTTREVDRRPRLISPEVSDLAYDFASGMVTGDSSAPPLAAFGQGMFGAMKSERDRTEAERTAALDAEKLTYDRGRDAVADARAEEEMQIKRDTFEAQKAGEGYWDKNNVLKYVLPDGSDLTAEGEITITKIADSWAATQMRILSSSNNRLRGDALADAVMAVQDRRDEYYNALRKRLLEGGLDITVEEPESVAGAPGEDAAPEAPAKPGGEAVKPATITENGTKANPWRSEDAIVRPGEYYDDGTGNIVQLPLE